MDEGWMSKISLAFLHTRLNALIYDLPNAKFLATHDAIENDHSFKGQDSIMSCGLDGVPQEVEPYVYSREKIPTVHGPKGSILPCLTRLCKCQQHLPGILLCGFVYQQTILIVGRWNDSK